MLLRSLVFFTLLHSGITRNITAWRKMQCAPLKFGLHFLATLWHNQEYRSLKMETVCSTDICCFLTYYSLSYLIIIKREDRGSMLLRSLVFSTLLHSLLPQKITERSEEFLVKMSVDQLLTKDSADCSWTFNSLALFKLVTLLSGWI